MRLFALIVQLSVSFLFEITIIFQAASSARVSPLRLSFTGTLRVIRRALPKFQRLQPQELPFF
jgi:hypothetical protein